MRASQRPLLSIEFSFRNEEDVLTELVRRVRQVMKELSARTEISGYELVFVNDA